MTRVAEFRPQQAGASDEWHLRVDLTGLAAMHGWHESVAGPFFAGGLTGWQIIPDESALAPFLAHQASDLLKLDADDRSTMERDDAPDPTAWYIHGRMHAALPRHASSPSASALCHRAGGAR